VSAPLVIEGDVERAFDWLVERATARDYVDRLPLAGISVGGCVDAHGTDRQGAMRRQAHTHVGQDDPNRGWICVLATRSDRLVSATGLPTALFRHEYAHLLAPTDLGHGQRWRAAVTALGAPGEAKRAERRSAHRRARAASTLYYVGGQLVSRDEYRARP
jgi:hypothetical protein